MFILGGQDYGNTFAERRDATKPSGGTDGITLTGVPAAAIALETRGDVLDARVVDTLAGLDQLKDVWNILQNAARSRATAFQSFSMCKKLAQHMELGGNSPTLHVVVIGAPGEAPKLILPMFIETHAGLKIARWLGSPMLQYGDALCADIVDDAMMALALNACGKIGAPDVFDFRNVRADAAIAPWLDNNSRPTGVDSEGPFVDLSSGKPDVVFAHQSGRKRKDRRRKLRKLSEHGNVDFEIVRNGDRAAQLMTSALEFKLKWLETHGLVSRALSQDWVRTALVEIARYDPDTIISRFAVGSETAAIEVGFRRANRYFAFMGAINDKYAFGSPGDLQTERTLQWCLEEGFDSYDFLPPPQRYKLSWATGSTPVRSYTVATTIGGRLYDRVFLEVVEPGLKAAYHNTPEWLRRAAIRVFKRG